MVPKLSGLANSNLYSAAWRHIPGCCSGSLTAQTLSQCVNHLNVDAIRLGRKSLSHWLGLESAWKWPRANGHPFGSPRATDDKLAWPRIITCARRWATCVCVFVCVCVSGWATNLILSLSSSSSLDLDAIESRASSAGPPRDHRYHHGQARPSGLLPGASNCVEWAKNRPPHSVTPQLQLPNEQ